MVYAILRSSAELAHWPGEAHEVWEADHHPALSGWDSNALGASDVTASSAARIRRSFFLVTGPRRRLIDKTPRNALRVAFVDTIFPDALYVFLQRDGRDNVNSLINAWRTSRYRTYRMPQPHSIPGVDPQWWKFVLYPGWREDSSGPLEVVCARQWSACCEAALQAARAIDASRWITLSYESLVEDPEAAVGEVCDRLGLSFGGEMRRRAAEARSKPVNVVTPPERGKWRRENPGAIEAILPLIAPTMAKLGYSTHED